MFVQKFIKHLFVLVAYADRRWGADIINADAFI